MINIYLSWLEEAWATDPCQMSHIRADFTLLHASVVLYNSNGDVQVCVCGWICLQANYWLIRPLQVKRY